MNVLVGFEESQEVTAAFIAAGHNAMSCDKNYPGAKGLPHYQGDIFDVLREGWDLIILHPPCTYTALCGNRWYWNDDLRQEGVKLCKDSWDTARSFCKSVALEQPKTIMQKFIGRRSQTIHPWQFGHMETKETWLWLWNLPPLEETNNVYEAMMQLTKAERNRIHYMSPSCERQRLRSQTFSGIAKAMPAQWTKFIQEN